MELFTKVQIPKGKRALTKVVGNELLVYFTYSSNIEKPEVKEKEKKVYYLYSDGACRGNGSKNSVAGAGAVIYNGEKIKSVSSYLGKGITNNEAEYQALILGLEEAMELGIEHIKAHVDSKLVCEQVLGNWKVNKSELAVLCDKVCKLVKRFDSFEIVHILRHKNTVADGLANEALDN